MRRRVVAAVAGIAIAAAAAVLAARGCGGATGTDGTTRTVGVVADGAGRTSATDPLVGTAAASPRGRAARPDGIGGGPDAEASTPEPLARDLAVTFVVLRAEDRTPIEGAQVLIRDANGHREFATDGAGQATFDVVPGDLDYGVLAAGRARRQGTETFEPDGARASELLLVPGAQAVGRVTDAATGAPIAGAGVEVRAGGFDGWDEIQHRGGWEVGRARTDGEGRFRIEGLARDETFTLRASAEGYAASERPVMPEATGECRTDVALGRGRTLRIQALDEHGAPLATAFVVVVVAHLGESRGSPFDPDRLWRQVDREGRRVFERLLRDAVYDVRVHRSDPSDNVPTAPDFIDLRVPPGPEDVERVVRFQAPATLRVLASNADGTPWEGRDASALLSAATESGGPYEDVVFALRSARAADGRDAWVLQPGRYRVGLVRWNLFDPESQDVVLVPGDDRVVEFRLRSGVLDGRVVDPEGNPVPHGIAILHGLTDLDGYTQASVSHGALRVTGFAPGRWRVFLSGEWGDESGFVAADVDVPSEPREWRLVRDPTARIRLPGETVGREVHVHVDGPERVPSRQSRSADGWNRSMWEHDGEVPPDATFSFKVQSFGPLRFRIRVEGFLPVAVETPAPAGEDFDVVVPSLVRGIDVVGRVVDAAGSPVKSSVDIVSPVEFDDNRWQTDDDGRFRIPGLPPGPVLLAVEPLRHRAKRSVRLVAREGMDPVEVVASRGGTLDVLCTDARGVPLPGRRIDAEAADRAVDDGPLATERTTDARGRAQFRVHPGTWRVHTLDVHAVVELAEGATAPVRLVVR